MGRRSFLHDTRGASLVEYLILLGMCVVVLLGGLRAFGGTVWARVSSQADHVARLEGDESGDFAAGTGLGARSRSGAGNSQSATSGPPTVPGMFENLQTSFSNAASPHVSPNGAALCFGDTCVGGMCFRAGTPVVTAAGARAIEEIEPGDQVLSRDPATGAVAWRRVVRRIVTPRSATLDLRLEDEDGRVDTLGVTAAHPFWIRGRGWVTAGRLEVGDEGLSADGKAVRVAGLSTEDGSTTVYNLEVEEFHTYFVGATETWVHNDCTPEKVTHDEQGGAPHTRIESERGGGFAIDLERTGKVTVKLVVSSPAAGTKLPPIEVPFTGSFKPRIVKTTEDAVIVSLDGGDKPHLMVHGTTQPFGDGLAWSDRLVPYRSGRDKLVLKALPKDTKSQSIIVAGPGIETTTRQWITPLPPKDYILEPTWKYQKIGKIEGWRRKDGEFVSNGFYNNVGSARITAMIFESYAVNWVRATPFAGNMVMVGEAVSGTEITGRRMGPNERIWHGTIAAVLLAADAAPIALEVNAARKMAAGELARATGLTEREAAAFIKASKQLKPEERAILEAAEKDLRAGKTIDPSKITPILSKIERAVVGAEQIGKVELSVQVRAAANRAAEVTRDAKAVAEEGRWARSAADRGGDAGLKAAKLARLEGAEKAVQEATEAAREATDALKSAKTPEGLRVAEEALQQAKQGIDAAKADIDTVRLYDKLARDASAGGKVTEKSLADLEAILAIEKQGRLPSTEGPLAAKLAVSRRFSKLDWDLEDVLHNLIDDSAHRLNVVEALKDPASRAKTLDILDELKAQRMTQRGQKHFDSVLEANPGQGPLFEKVAPEINTNGSGVSRKTAHVEAAKQKDAALEVGPDPTPAQTEEVRRWARHLKDTVEPSVSDEIAAITKELEEQFGGGVSFSVRTKNADGLVDKVQRMTGGSAGRPVRPDYRVGDVIDAVGARITVDDMDQLAATLEKVKTKFGTGDGGRILEIENMYASPKPNSPRYRVIPMVIRSKDGTATFELQLTTRRASIAADLDHNIGYKELVEASESQRRLIEDLQKEAAVLDQMETTVRKSAPDVRTPRK